MNRAREVRPSSLSEVSGILLELRSSAALRVDNERRVAVISRANPFEKECVLLLKKFDLYISVAEFTRVHFCCLLQA